VTIMLTDPRRRPQGAVGPKMAATRPSKHGPRAAVTADVTRVATSIGAGGSGILTGVTMELFLRELARRLVAVETNWKQPQAMSIVRAHRASL